MALSGSLSEFDISYIFQIISQESKTGILTIQSEKNNGYIVFKNGSIISAGTNQQTLQTLIINYLKQIKKYPTQELRELQSLVKKNLQYFSQELIQKKYLSHEELSLLAANNIEDIACSIFHWKKGTYIFESSKYVEFHNCGNFSTTADAITMEAARQFDELGRMKATINPQSVFKPVPIPENIKRETVIEKDAISDSKEVLENFTEYIRSLIDGNLSTTSLCQQSFFSEYRIYESLYTLFEEHKILVAQNPKVGTNTTNSNEQLDDNEPIPSKIFLSILLTFTIIICLYFSGHIFLHGYILSDSQTKGSAKRTEFSRIKTRRLVKSAVIQYTADFGQPPTLIQDLVQNRILSNRDLRTFVRKEINSNKFIIPLKQNRNVIDRIFSILKSHKK